MTKTIVYLCHVWLGTHTQLFVTHDHLICYLEPRAQQVWVEKYNLKDSWEKQRLGHICGWSNQRCPLVDR